MLDIDLAYAAGIIDGEGCIYISRHKRINRENFTLALKVNVIMCDLEVIDWFKKTFNGDLFGGGVYKMPPNKKSNQCRPSYMWGISNSGAINFLKMVLPYLKLKTKQAQEAIKFEKTLFAFDRHAKNGTFLPIPEGLLEQREKIKKQIMSLNRRGKPNEFR